MNTIHVMEIRSNGDTEEKHLKSQDFLHALSEKRLPFRDLRMILKPSDKGGLTSIKGSCSFYSNCIQIIYYQNCFQLWRIPYFRHPALMPRPSSNCYILEMEHIKLICLTDKCIILNPDQKPTKAFINNLSEQLRCVSRDYVKINGVASIRILYQKNAQDSCFELIVLEAALDHVVRKFGRHLQIIKPSVEMILQQIEANPETNGLKRLLAVKKSFAEFEQKVEHYAKILRNILADDEDMKSLHLSNEDDGANAHEDVELLLGSYSADLEEITTEIKIFIDMIEDTDQFISAHLDSVRNEIIKMSLFIEVGALVMGFGAVVSGIFGMNLTNFLEENSYAFLVVCVSIMIAMSIFFAGFTKKYYQLKADTTSAQSFSLLKNFFTYVDDLEYYIFNKKIERAEFKNALEKITGLKVTEKELEYLFKMIDTNKDGLIDLESELALYTPQREQKYFLTDLNNDKKSSPKSSSIPDIA